MTIVDNADDNDANDDDDEELDKEDGGDSNGDDDNGDGRDVKPQKGDFLNYGLLGHPLYLFTDDHFDAAFDQLLYFDDALDNHIWLHHS